MEPEVVGLKKQDYATLIQELVPEIDSNDMLDAAFEKIYLKLMDQKEQIESLEEKLDRHNNA